MLYSGSLCSIKVISDNGYATKNVKSRCETSHLLKLLEVLFVLASWI
jgi:hypothetical protein